MQVVEDNLAAVLAQLGGMSAVMMMMMVMKKEMKHEMGVWVRWAE